VRDGVRAASKPKPGLSEPTAHGPWGRRPLAERAYAMLPSPIRLVAEEGQGRSDVIPLFYGEGSWPTDPEVVAAGTRALDGGAHFYTPNAGLPELRAAISAYYRDHLDLDIPPSRIIVTGSGMQALALAAQALVNPGDKALVVGPVWPNMPETLKLVGADVEFFRLAPDRQGRWTLDLPALLFAITPDVRVLVFNSPNNPTGWTASNEDLSAIRARARETGTWIISDDVYQRLTFDAPSAPFILAGAHADEQIVSVNSFSKAWSMTGWRLGWLVVPNVVATALEPLTEFNISCVPEFTQTAGVAALKASERIVTELMGRLTAGRAIVSEGLGAMPHVTYAPAEGYFYAFFQVEGLDDSLTTARRLLTEEGVGLAPGVAFGAEGWLRLCYAQEPQILADAMSRLSRFCAGLHRA